MTSRKTQIAHQQAGRRLAGGAVASVASMRSVAFPVASSRCNAPLHHQPPPLSSLTFIQPLAVFLPSLLLHRQKMRNRMRPSPPLMPTAQPVPSNSRRATRERRREGKEISQRRHVYRSLPSHVHIIIIIIISVRKQLNQRKTL
ncbi:uncharacterized protein J3D65DRAFT_628357, partial [Phyllosticta citribraziliensis]